MARKRSDPRTAGDRIKRRALSSEDRLTGLCTQVNLACTKWLASRGLITEGHCWTKRINYLGDDE